MYGMLCSELKGSNKEFPDVELPRIAALSAKADSKNCILANLFTLEIIVFPL